ncbi:MAG: penicillin-binding transpeptidase domain-containing protein, partial [Peptostreptococcaceae bacterium]
GSVNLRYATEISINTIPYRLTSEFGTEKAVSYLADMNFKYLTSSDFLYPIVAVGGFERGVTTVEMASGFSTIARNGNFIEPTNVSKITKIGSEDIVYENTRIEKEIYKSSAAYMMTDVLKGVISQGHGTGAGYKINYPHQAGKTGTTNSNYDYWFSGYTPYYSMAVWVGDDIPAYQNSSSRVAGSIWQEYMNYLHVGKEVIDFEMPNTVTSSNGILKGNEVSNDKLISDRQTLDKNRINREIRENQLRLDSEDYRIIHGLTLEEETWNQQYADDFLSRLSNFNFTNLEQESEYRELYKDAEIAVNGVKNKAAYEERKQRLSFAQINMNDKIQNLIYKIELDRLEAERLENERIERERLEAERLEQERLDALNPPVPEVLVPEITTPEVEEDIVIPESIVPENNLGGDLNDFDNVVNNEISSGGIQEQFPPE